MNEITKWLLEQTDADCRKKDRYGPFHRARGQKYPSKLDFFHLGQSESILIVLFMNFSSVLRSKIPCKNFFGKAEKIQRIAKNNQERVFKSILNYFNTLGSFWTKRIHSGPVCSRRQCFQSYLFSMKSKPLLCWLICQTRLKRIKSDIASWRSLWK